MSNDSVYYSLLKSTQYYTHTIRYYTQTPQFTYYYLRLLYPTLPPPHSSSRVINVTIPYFLWPLYFTTENVAKVMICKVRSDTYSHLLHRYDIK